VKILVVGDEFISSKLLQKRLHLRLKPIVKELKYELMDFKETDAPTEEYRDIDEYWGNTKPLLRKIDGCEILVIVDAPVTKEVIEAGKELRVIGCTRGGPVNVNISEATRRGIPVLYAAGRNSSAVADLTIGLMLAVMRRIAMAEGFLRSGKWKRNKQDTFDKPSGPELSGKRIGILGFGQVGKKVAKRLSGFDTQIMVCDPYVSRKNIEEAGYVCASLGRLLKESDVVTLHLRAPPERAGWFDMEKFRSMKRTSYIVNTSRGYLVNEGDLVKALKEGFIAGAALDVFETEPLSVGSHLLEMDNVILTPHVAGISAEVPYRSSTILADQLAEYLTGKRPANILNPEVLKRGRATKGR
jgi:D-3-phosphoglycerate dehydrogenase